MNNKEIYEIVEQVKQKEKEGDKALKDYLFSLDINTLNRLLLIFNGPEAVTEFDLLRSAFIVATAVGAVLTYVIMTSDYFFYTKLNIALFFLAFAIYWAFYVNYFKYREKSIIRRSYRSIKKQKLITLIGFVLQEKYKEL